MGRVFVTPLEEDKLKDVPWSARSYPFPEPAFAPDDRERAMATERLFWRSDGSLAYRAGLEYPIDEAPLLWTWDEMMAPPKPTKKAKR